MRKALTAAMAALTLGGAISATATAADARPGYHGGYHRGGGYYHRGNGGAAVAAGVVGLALGAAIASNHSYGHPYYGGGYYAPGPYAYGPGYYGTCYTTRWAWDPYYGRRVPVREAYAC